MPSPRYFLAEGNLRSGPHSLDVLKQKAEIHVITADTLVAPETAPDQWTPLRALDSLAAELFPARPKLTLAARPAETGNHAHAPPSASVDEILRSNLARQQAAEGELLKPHPPRSNKRRNDYLLLAAGLNTIVALRLLLGSPFYDPFLVGLFVIGNLSLVWVMFFVMDRY